MNMTEYLLRLLRTALHYSCKVYRANEGEYKVVLNQGNTYSFNRYLLSDRMKLRFLAYFAQK